MPNINLRLTEQEHAALERWARDGHRSLQKEIIFRLFSKEEIEQVVEEYVREDRGLPPRQSVDQDWLLRRAGKKK